MTFFLGVKWILAPACFVIGCGLRYVAYVQPDDKRPFRVRDLFVGTIFTRHPVGYQTKEQLRIEGILCIALGIIGFVVF